MKDNSTLKQRVHDMTDKMKNEATQESNTKNEITRLNKDIQRKRTLIDDLQQKLKDKEKQLNEVMGIIDLLVSCYRSLQLLDKTNNVIA